MAFGQMVVGPPGSGKSTCCKGLQHYFALTGRPAAVINLDPANDCLPYEASVDISDLVSLEEVTAEFGLGPNGGLLYCISYLEQNLDWLQEQLQPLQAGGKYLIFDCPGQLELYTFDTAFKKVVDTMTNTWHYRLAGVNLVDAQLCTDAGKYVAALLASLSTMLHLELPHVNLLSKADLIPSFGELDFDLTFYLEAQGLEHLVAAMAHGSSIPHRFQKLARELCEVVEEFGLVQFLPLAIEDKDSVQAAIAAIDKATGYVFKGLERYDPYPEMTYAATAQPVHIPSSVEAPELDSDGTTSQQEQIGEIVERTRLLHH